MTVKQKEQIRRLRGEGHGYGDIAGLLGVPLNSIKSFCRREGLTGRKTAAGNVPSETDTCWCCGLPVRQNPGRKAKKFCSDACRMKWWSDHPEKRHRNAVVESICPHCSKPFTAYATAHRKYCCHACYIADRFGGGKNEQEG